MDPLSHKMREQLRPSAIKTQKFLNEKVVKNVSQEAFELIMDSFKENESELEDSELISQIAKKLAENICLIPSNSPFSETDMVIFKDQYKGNIPRNGHPRRRSKLYHPNLS